MNEEIQEWLRRLAEQFAEGVENALNKEESPWSGIDTVNETKERVAAKEEEVGKTGSKATGPNLHFDFNSSETSTLPFGWVADEDQGKLPDNYIQDETDDQEDRHEEYTMITFTGFAGNKYAILRELNGLVKEGWVLKSSHETYLLLSR